jgi:GntR family transcriptional regulator
MQITKSLEVLSPVMPNLEQRQLLKIPQNLPCMAIERFSYEADALIEYTTSVVRGDKFKFEAELKI